MKTNAGQGGRAAEAKLKALAGCSALLSLLGCATVPVGDAGGTADALVAESVCEFTRDPEPEGLSGISRIGGNRYYCVNDRGGMLHELEIVLNDDGEIALCQTVRSVRLEGRVDLEDCAVDPLDGRVWVSDEHDHSVRQFDPKTGRETGRVDLPDVFAKNMVPNRSFEALALSPDGLRLYVANEDTLRCDGPVANGRHGGCVRIQEFARTGRGAAWTPARQFRYNTEKIEGEPFLGLEMSGVAALCVADERTLLVLEREMSRKHPLVPSFLARLYAVSLDQPDGTVRKRLVWEENTSFANYEGICLGPVLKDGRRALVLVSDGGGKTDESLLVLSLGR